MEETTDPQRRQYCNVLLWKAVRGCKSMWSHLLFHRRVKWGSEKERDLLKVTKNSLVTGFTSCLYINSGKDADWLFWVTCLSLHHSLWPRGSPSAWVTTCVLTPWVTAPPQPTKYSSLRCHGTGSSSGPGLECYLFREAFLNHSPKRRPLPLTLLSFSFFLHKLIILWHYFSFLTRIKSS